MPIEVECIELGIYRAIWLGAVTVKEVQDEMQTTLNLVSENQDKVFVLLVDLSNVKQIPFDVARLRKVADLDERTTAFVVVKAPVVAQILGDLLDRVSSKTFKFANTLEDAVTIARNLLPTLQAKN